MRALLLVATTLLWLGVHAQSAAPSKKEQKVRQYLERGKAYKALNQCNAMLNARSPKPEFHALRADALNRIGEHVSAERDARAGLAAFPGNTEALLQLAIAEQGLGRYDSAVTHYQRALEQGATSDAHYRLAQTYQARKECTAAIDQLNTILQTARTGDPTTARYHRSLGECYAVQGDSTRALSEFELAISLAPDDPVTYNSRGWFVHAARGDHAAAIADYDRAIRRNPNYSYAFNNRGWSYYKLGDTKKALRDIGTARRKKVFNPFIYRNLGIIDLENGDLIGACTYFRQALDYNFTALYGDEVEKLIEANCGQESKGNAPLQTPNAPIDRPVKDPPTRSNAP